VVENIAELIRLRAAERDHDEVVGPRDIALNTRLIDELGLQEAGRLKTGECVGWPPIGEQGGVRQPPRVTPTEPQWPRIERILRAILEVNVLGIGFRMEHEPDIGLGTGFAGWHICAPGTRLAIIQA